MIGETKTQTIYRGIAGMMMIYANIFKYFMMEVKTGINSDNFNECSIFVVIFAPIIVY